MNVDSIKREQLVNVDPIKIKAIILRVNIAVIEKEMSPQLPLEVGPIDPVSLIVNIGINNYWMRH